MAFFLTFFLMVFFVAYLKGETWVGIGKLRLNNVGFVLGLEIVSN
jgi:hypothetical protein